MRWLVMILVNQCCVLYVVYVVVAQQSSSVFDVVKRDLAEFTSTMQQDSSKVATTVKEKLTVSLAL